jgi:CheY-like chemotaxis protein
MTSDLPRIGKDERRDRAMARKKILLVDDSSTARLLARMVLQDSAYEVITARDGVEGIEKAKTEKPDLILLDVMMPNMDGIEACKRLRDEAATAAIPIIMVTTRGEEGIAEASYAYGCNEFVTKPVDPAELLAKVRNCLGEWEGT